MAVSEYCKLEMIYYCYQYEELKEELFELEYNMKSPDMTGDRIITNDYQSNVERSAIRAAAISAKLDRIERTAREVTKKEPSMYPYLLKAVTDEHCTCDYLVMNGMPCSRNTLYRYKRKFYDHLSKYFN